MLERIFIYKVTNLNKVHKQISLAHFKAVTGNRFFELLNVGVTSNKFYYCFTINNNQNQKNNPDGDDVRPGATFLNYTDMTNCWWESYWMVPYFD